MELCCVLPISFFLRSRSRPKSDSFDPKILNRAKGGNVGTIRRWIWAAVFVAITACFSWVGPSVYSIKYALSADKIYLDPKPPDCDFWHAPVGNKGCHYQSVVIARDQRRFARYAAATATPIGDSTLFLSHGSKNLIDYLASCGS